MAWIDVNDRLPDLHDDVWDDGDEVVHYKVSDPVLCVYNGGEQTVAVYEIDGDVDFSGWVNCHDSSDLHTVTHWMELPAFIFKETLTDSMMTFWRSMGASRSRTFREITMG